MRIRMPNIIDEMGVKFENEIIIDLSVSSHTANINYNYCSYN